MVGWNPRSSNSSKIRSLLGGGCLTFFGVGSGALGGLTPASSIQVPALSGRMRFASHLLKGGNPVFGCRMGREQVVEALTVQRIDDEHVGGRRIALGIGVDHPMSLEDIGDKFGLTRERVRQIKDKAISKLRTTSKSRVLKAYLGS